MNFLDLRSGFDGKNRGTDQLDRSTANQGYRSRTVPQVWSQNRGTDQPQKQGYRSGKAWKTGGTDQLGKLIKFPRWKRALATLCPCYGDWRCSGNALAMLWRSNDALTLCHMLWRSWVSNAPQTRSERSERSEASARRPPRIWRNSLELRPPPAADCFANVRLYKLFPVLWCFFVFLEFFPMFWCSQLCKTISHMLWSRGQPSQTLQRVLQLNKVFKDVVTCYESFLLLARFPFIC